MQDIRTPPRAGYQSNAAALRGAEATLNEQLARDSSGKLQEQVLDELAVAAQEIELTLAGNDLPEGDAQVLRDLLDAVRLGESIVTQTWQSVHG
jgi:hypothetical protein